MAGIWTRANSGALLCTGDRSTVKNCTSYPPRESFLSVVRRQARAARATDVNVRMHRRRAIMSLPKVDKHSRDYRIFVTLVSHRFNTIPL